MNTNNHLSADEIEAQAWANDKSTPKTRAEVEKYLAIEQYHGKFQIAMDRTPQGKLYWNGVTNYFLSLGGLFRAQLYNNGNNQL